MTIRNISGTFQYLNLSGLSVFNNQPGLLDNEEINLLHNNIPAEIYGNQKLGSLIESGDLIVIDNGVRLDQQASIDYFRSQSKSIQNISSSIVTSDSAILVAPTLISNQDNFNPLGFQENGDGRILISELWLSAAGNQRLTGIKAPNPPVRSRIIIYNAGSVAGSNTINIRNNNPFSLPENRFEMPGNVNLVFRRKLVFDYNIDSLKWNVIE